MPPKILPRETLAANLKFESKDGIAAYPSTPKGNVAHFTLGAYFEKKYFGVGAYSWRLIRRWGLISQKISLGGGLFEEGLLEAWGLIQGLTVVLFFPIIF